MGQNSGIEWTHHTFNPWIGCQKVGPGCDNCYAEAWDDRFDGKRWGPHQKRTKTTVGYWDQPRRWAARAEAAGIRQRVFCASLADVFDMHPSIYSGWRIELGELIRQTSEALDWMLLTKRIGNAQSALGTMFPAGVPANVWVGLTVVNQQEVDRDAQKLRRLKHRLGLKRAFLSMEPLVGAASIGMHLVEGFVDDWTVLPGLDLVIVGGESGRHARPMNPAWVRLIRDECLAARVPFFFKQWGEWAPGEFVADSNDEYYDGPTLYCEEDDSDDVSRYPGLVWHPETGLPVDRWTLLPDFCFDGAPIPASRRVGKKRAGRKLDARTWDGMPESAWGAR